MKDIRKQEFESIAELPEWQKQLIDDRLIDFYQNPTDCMDFDKLLDDIEKNL